MTDTTTAIIPLGPQGAFHTPSYEAQTPHLLPLATSRSSLRSFCLHLP